MPKQKQTSTRPSGKPSAEGSEASPPSAVELPLSQFAEVATQMPLEFVAVEIWGERFEVPSDSSPKQSGDESP